ncbi:HypC/HybG/HupF family hydrogenase formation chaperone [Dongia sp.]|uniref:HypC/HybG/HupF family hydrogenase formation chaperone n=1 Tax=Dongia sp. TaxID=1977262 RepID=UPI0035B111B2
MCIGIPMRVISGNGFAALCEGSGRRAEIDMRLVGAQQPGTWVLTFLGAAREILDAEEAQRIADALLALEISMRGGTPPEALFADLIDRTPQLPDFLRPTAAIANKETD